MLKKKAGSNLKFINTDTAKSVYLHLENKTLQIGLPSSKYSYIALAFCVFLLVLATTALGQGGGTTNRVPFGTMAEEGVQVRGNSTGRISPFARFKYKRFYRNYKVAQKGRYTKSTDGRYKYLTGHYSRKKLNRPSHAKRLSYKNLSKYTRRLSIIEESNAEANRPSFRVRGRISATLDRYRITKQPGPQICFPRFKITRRSWDQACLPKIVIKHYSHDANSCPTYNVKHRHSSNYAVYCDPGMKITTNMQRVAKDVKHFFTNHRKHCKINTVHSGVAVGQVLMDTVEYRPIFFLKKTRKVAKPIVSDFVIRKRVIQYYLHSPRKSNRRKRKNKKYDGVKHLKVLIPRKPNFLVKLGFLNTFTQKRLSKDETKKVMLHAMRDKLTKTHSAMAERYPYINNPSSGDWEWKLKTIVRVYPEERENLEDIKLQIISQENVVKTTRDSDNGDVHYIEIKRPAPVEENDGATE